MRRFLTVFCLCLLLLPGAAFADDLSGLFPDKVGDLARVSLKVGQAAQNEVNKLHGKILSAEASAIGRYMSEGAKERPAEVWVSRVESENEARRQTGLMVHKMYENPKSPFKNPKRIDRGEIAVYRFTGMGQIHLIWFKGDLVYWISTPSAAEETLLSVFCR